MTKSKIPLIIGLLFSQQAFSSCDFSLKNALIFSNQKKHQIKISIEQACSKNAQYKRELQNPTLEIFRDGKVIGKMAFKKGFWLESSKKFHFKGIKGRHPGCENLTSLTLNLEKDIVTSLSGNYLNLAKEKSPTWKCALNRR